MPCYHPLKAMRSSSGVTVLPSDAVLFNLQLPCGQCVGCRLERSRQWAIRVMHEASLYQDNAYITLTYDDEHCPPDGGLHHRDFQLFLKRLRKHFKDKPLRYYMCGEYGENYGRPHFHAILFNVNFGDYTLWRQSSSGFNLYRSATLERLWPYGYSSIGDVTFESAAYVARYIMKKRTGAGSEGHYEVLDESTGEIYSRRPEYNRMSLKPGIGAKWFEKYQSDVFPHDRVVIDGAVSKPPRYYDKLLKAVDSSMFEIVQENRLDFVKVFDKNVVDVLKNYHDNTPQRLHSKELVANAKLSQLKRGLTK